MSCVMASAISLGYVDGTVDEYRAALTVSFVEKDYLLLLFNFSFSLGIKL